MSDAKLARFLIAAPLVVAGALFALYGLFALTFREGGGSTYVTLAGHQFDAHLVGAVSLVIGLVIVAGAVTLARRGGST
jgi:hypothetical protein